MRPDRPSSTATLIAAATVFLARDPRLADLVPAGAAERCARCLAAVSPRRLAAVETVSRRELRWAGRLAERATVPGLLLHFILRKRWIEAAVRAVLAAGVRQIVVVGAGFDTLAGRLGPEFPEARFIEVDHPATQRCRRLASRDHETANLVFVEADLARTGLAGVLADVYDRATPSVFVIEGLLMYLTDREVGALFETLAGLQRAGGRVVFTQMEPAADGRSRFHNATALANGLLAWWSEPFKSALPRGEAAPFLAGFGYRATEVAASEQLRERYLKPPRQSLPLAEGELIVVGGR